MEYSYIGFFDKNLTLYNTFIWILLPFAIIALLAIIYKLIKNIKNKKSFTNLIIILIILSLYFSQLLSTNFVRLAMLSQNSKNFNTYYQLAIKTSIFPSQRAFHKYMYAGDLSNIYKDYPKALKYYYQVYNYTKSYNKPLTLWLGIINNEIKMNNLDQALNVAKKIGKSYAIADIYLLKGDYKTAITYYNKAIEENPKDYSNYYHRAIAYKNINENKLAEENINQAIKYCRQSNMDLRNRYNQSQMLHFNNK